MKVLHVIPHLNTGGPQKSLTVLLPALARLGIEPTVLVYRLSNSRLEYDLMEAGIRLQSIETRNPLGLRVFNALRREGVRYDVVHTHLEPAMHQVALALKSSGVRLVHTEHGDSPLRHMGVLRPLERAVYSCYDRVVTESDTMRRALSLWLAPDRSLETRMMTIPPGVDLDPIRSARPAPGLGTRRRVITMVANFTPARDQRSLIRALPLLSDPDVELAFVGCGRFVRQHMQYAELLGVNRRCRFLGWRDDIPSIILGSAIGVQAAVGPGYGLAPIEFMGAGKPVVASDLPALHELLGDAGVYFDALDESMLARQLNRLLDDPSYYREVSERSLARSEQFHIDITAGAYARMYEEILRL